MRYIANDNGYLQEVSFGAMIQCGGRGCTEYTGGVPAGYDSLADWFAQECGQLHKWRIVAGQLVEDPDAPEPEEAKGVRLLWEGSWTSGKITVPDTDKYTAFSIGMSGQGTTIIAFKRWTHIRGIGGYSQGNGEMTSYHFTATFEGNTWNFVACNKYKHYASSDHGSNDACTITDIYGLF